MGYDLMWILLEQWNKNIVTFCKILITSSFLKRKILRHKSKSPFLILWTSENTWKFWLSGEIRGFLQRSLLKQLPRMVTFYLKAPGLFKKKFGGHQSFLWSHWWCLFLTELYALTKFLFFFLVLQKQVHTLPVDHSNNSKKEDKILLLIFFIWNTSIHKIQLNISSNNSKMSNY